MSIIEKDIAQAAFTTSLTTVYTVPAETRTYIKDFDICNTTIGILSATVHFVRPSASPSDANKIVPGVVLSGNTMLQWTGLQILPAGSTIQIMGSGLGLTLNMSGAEST